jgi:hypothetical protein
MIEFTNNTKKITVDVKPQVVIQSSVRIDGLGTLPVEIIGDFTNIPQQYHELFIRGMLAAYSPLEETKPKSAITKQKKSYLSWLRAF